MNNPRKPGRRRPLTIVLFGLAWIAAIAIGAHGLMSYEASPGGVGAVRRDWPATSKISRPNEQLALIMLAHPRCPCTRASINELGKIMAHGQGKVSAYVLFLKPRGASLDWEDTELRRSAAKIPGVNVLSDVDGLEARKFGAETSGHTFLFDRNGRLLFSGGITQSRGHSGDNAGESAIVALVNNHRAGRARTFVFGCSLVDRNQKRNRAQCLN
jgi:hypothetical protein